MAPQLVCMDWWQVSQLSLVSALQQMTRVCSCKLRTNPTNVVKRQHETVWGAKGSSGSDSRDADSAALVTSCLNVLIVVIHSFNPSMHLFLHFTSTSLLSAELVFSGMTLFCKVLFFPPSSFLYLLCCPRRRRDFPHTCLYMLPP